MTKKRGKEGGGVKERAREPTDGGFGKASATPVLQKPEASLTWHSHGLAAGTEVGMSAITALPSGFVATTEGIWWKKIILTSVKREKTLIVPIVSDGNSIVCTIQQLSYYRDN